MRQVKIIGGMKEFHGRTGTAVREGKMWRVYLDEPVLIESIGYVADDLWEGHLLKTVKVPRGFWAGFPE